MNSDAIWPFLLLQAGLVLGLGVAWLGYKARANRRSSSRQRELVVLAMSVPLAVVAVEVIAFSLLFSPET